MWELGSIRARLDTPLRSCAGRGLLYIIQLAIMSKHTRTQGGDGEQMARAREPAGLA